MKVTFRNKSANPFYGLRACLTLYQNSDKMISPHMLDAAWEEVKGDKEHKQMFWSLLFSIGDITARRHKIFKGKVDSGGTASRQNFYLIVKWMKQHHFPQFVKFMWARLFNEFVSFDAILANRIQTQKKTDRVAGIVDQISDPNQSREQIAKYIAHIIKGDDVFDKMLVAKFLTRPRMSKRSKHKKMLPVTRTMMLNRQNFLKLVSDFADLPYVVKNNYINFTGYYQWKKQFNTNLESVMFSTKEVLKLDEQQFIAWVAQLPASARFRVRARLLTKDNKPKPKWGSDLPQWFLKWENYKEEKQTEQRVLEVKIQEGVATEEDIAKLKEVKKEAKVNVGAVNFATLFLEILQENADKVRIQPFLDKIKLDYNTLVFLDDSGSMTSRTHHGFSAFDFGCFMATICLAKNPDSLAQNLIGFFSYNTRMFSHIDGVRRSQNSILQGPVQTVSLPLYNPELHFLDNLYNMRGFAAAQRTGNLTDISSIPNDLARWTQGDSIKIEWLQQYPVWTIITDGNWNNLHSPEASMNDFMALCHKHFGYKPFIIAIDVSQFSADVTRLSGIENFMFVTPNPAQIEQLLTNFKDMDIMDVYTPLESLYRSNRYALVREAVM